jgi:hypothetical protein
MGIVENCDVWVAGEGKLVDKTSPLQAESIVSPESISKLTGHFFLQEKS